MKIKRIPSNKEEGGFRTEGIGVKMRINHNISALKANNYLSKTNNLLDNSLEKLSSGFRINHAADDAAGMAISEKMRTQINGLEQASRNASDGISVIQTAEGALVEVEAMLQRMRELSVQASNGTNTTEDRVAIQLEMDQLNQEIQRISDNTEFNTMTLLDGNLDTKSYSNNNNVKLVSLSDTVSVGEYSINVTKDARQAVIVGSASDLSASASGIVTINGESVEINATDTADQIYAKIRNTCDTLDINVFAVNVNADGTLIDTPDVAAYPTTAGYESQSFASGRALVFVSEEYGSDEQINIHCDSAGLADFLGLSITSVNAKGVDAEAKPVFNTTDPNSLFNNTATVSASGNKITVTDRNNFEMVFEVAQGTSKTVFIDCKIVDNDSSTAGSGGAGGSTVPVIVSVLDAGPIDLQIGANEGQTMTVRVPKVNPKTLGIDNINISTEDGAQEAITLLDIAINEISTIRSKLGAYQNRLEHSISNLDVTSENMTESLSRIEDVDMAEEMANYTQKNVLAQAGTAMLSQANQRPQTILSLLQS